MERKKTLNVFKEAERAWGSHDEFPVGPRGTDPMPHLSRSRVPQPFFSVCAADQVLVHMAGRGAILSPCRAGGMGSVSPAFFRG